MGIIKFKGQVVYEGPLARVKMVDNWCDSMATYYPYLGLHYFENGELRWRTWHVEGMFEPSDYKHLLVYPDKDQESKLDAMDEDRRQEEAAKKLDYHKKVRVVRGRKYPIGMEGEVFWMGNTQFGLRLGLRLLDDKRIFIDAKNVQCVEWLDKWGGGEDD